jgi:dTDP-4-dehydrorhamnose reductase
MSKILVTGKNGQLGKSIQKILVDNKQIHEFTFVGRSELDLSDNNNIINYFKNNIFDIIINCAAFTQVDKAEKEPKISNQVNHLAVRQLAKIAKKQQVRLIHISTDYVFDGKSNNLYGENDKTNPINTYGKTKLAGEKAIQKILKTNAVIIRVSWLYSEYGENFVKTILSLAKKKDQINVVNDQIGSPTYASDLAEVILKIIKNESFIKKNQKTQIYHYSNKGKISWYEFAKEIIKITKINCKVNPISSKNYPTQTKRPNIVLMNKTKISQSFSINILGLKKSLEKCISILLQ